MDYTRAHALEGARIRQELEERSQRIQHPDMMLAGVARSLDAPLVTADAGFERVDDLDIDNYREMFEDPDTHVSILRIHRFTPSESYSTLTRPSDRWLV